MVKPCRAMNRALPTLRTCPSHVARTPLPVATSKPSGSGTESLRAVAAPTTALASGWADCFSATAAILRKSSSATPSATSIPANPGVEVVSVPVLSRSTTSACERASRLAPPLTIMPRRAAFPIVEIKASGVDAENAQGVTTSSMVAALSTEPVRSQVSAAPRTTSGRTTNRNFSDYPLERNLLPLSLLHQGYDPRHGVLRGGSLGPHLDGTDKVVRAGEHLLARLPVDRYRLAREHRLVDGRLAANDVPVNREALARANLHDVSRL